MEPIIDRDPGDENEPIENDPEWDAEWWQAIKGIVDTELDNPPLGLL